MNINNENHIIFNDFSIKTSTPQSTSIAINNSLPMQGINIGNALEAPYEGLWGVHIKPSYFDRIKVAGFKLIRLPVKWSGHAMSAAPYTIDPSFFTRVDHNFSSLLGEFGAYSEAPLDSRIRWTAYIVEAAEKRNFSWTYWDFAQVFGIFGIYDSQTEKMEFGSNTSSPPTTDSGSISSSNSHSNIFKISGYPAFFILFLCGIFIQLIFSFRKGNGKKKRRKTF